MGCNANVVHRNIFTNLRPVLKMINIGPLLPIPFHKKVQSVENKYFHKKAKQHSDETWYTLIFISDLDLTWTKNVTHSCNFSTAPVRRIEGPNGYYSF